jgi:CRP-like cAMP-binding protein
MDHSIAALGPVEAVVLAPEVAQKLNVFPGIRRALALSSLVQVAIAREWLLNVGHRSSYERISHLFCEIHARQSAVGLVHDDGCDVPLTQTDIADALAISPVHVNRTLMELRRTGLVTFHNRRLVIHDLRTLRNAAGFDSAYLHLGTVPPADDAAAFFAFAPVA